MTVSRFAVSFDAELAKQVRRSAKGQPISAWLADAAERKLRAEGLLAEVSAWEAEHGEISRAELESVARQQRRARR
jgi:hypothetical protein